jgi:hypothetical protein
MTLPASGVISLGAIQTEFGGTNPIGINEYYRGGAYVGSWNTDVPTSGVISVSNFYNGTAVEQMIPRGVFGGGNPTSNVMDYITIPTTGNATDFGDLTAARYGLAGASSGFRGVFGGAIPIRWLLTLMSWITLPLVRQVTLLTLAT